MKYCRPWCFPISIGKKFSILDFPTSPLEMEDMGKVPYQIVSGSLMYAKVYNRPDISQVLRLLSKYMSNLGRVHWDTIKRAFRYLHGTSDYSLCYHSNLIEDNISLHIHGYIDLDWEGDVDSG
jgi:hypothetical protein